MPSLWLLEKGSVVHNVRGELFGNALLVRGHEIGWTGHIANDTIRDQFFKGAHFTNLKGRCIIPGFIDNYLSLNKLGSLLTWFYDLRDLRTVGEVQNRLRQIRELEPDLRFVIGHQIDLLGGQKLTSADLDLAMPDLPVFMLEKGEKSATVNSHLMKLARLGLPDYLRKGKKIFSTEPLRGRGHLPADLHPLALAVLPKPSRSDRIKMLLAAQRLALSQGITTAFEPEMDAELFDIYQDLERSGLLWMRVRGSFAWGKKANLKIFEQEPPSAFLRTKTVRLTLKNGFSESEWTLFKEQAFEAHGRGWQISVTAFDSKTLDALLTFFKKMYQMKPVREPRHRIEHVGCPTAAQIKLISDLRLGVVVHLPHLAMSSGAVLKLLGHENADSLLPLADFFRSGGARIALGSAAPSLPFFNPLHTMLAAVLGSKTERFYGKMDGFTPPMALWAHTRMAAQVCGDGELLGHFQNTDTKRRPKPPLADFVLLDGNPLFENPAKLTVLATVVDGLTRWAHPSVYRDMKDWPGLPVPRFLEEEERGGWGFTSKQAIFDRIL